MKCYQCDVTIAPKTSFCQSCGITLEFSTQMIYRALSYDTQAMAELYRATYDGVYQSIRQLVTDENTALAILTNAYISIYDNISKLRYPNLFPLWVKTCALNLCKSWLTRADPSDSEVTEKYYAIRYMKSMSMRA